MKKVIVVLIVVVVLLAGCGGSGSAGSGGPIVQAESLATADYFTEDQLRSLVSANGHDPDKMWLYCRTVVVGDYGQQGYFISCDVTIRDTVPEQLWLVVASNRQPVIASVQ
jgi:hypothetical protein